MTLLPSPSHFSAASSNAALIIGASRQEYPSHRVSHEIAAEWLCFIQNIGIERVSVCRTMRNCHILNISKPCP